LLHLVQDAPNIPFRNRAIAFGVVLARYKPSNRSSCDWSLLCLGKNQIASTVRAPSSPIHIHAEAFAHKTDEPFESFATWGACQFARVEGSQGSLSSRLIGVGVYLIPILCSPLWGVLVISP